MVRNVSCSRISKLAIAALLTMSCGGKSQDITYVVNGGTNGAGGSAPGGGEGAAGGTNPGHSGGLPGQLTGSGGAASSGDAGSPSAAGGSGDAGSPNAAGGSGDAGSPGASGEGGDGGQPMGEGGAPGDACGEGCFMDEQGACECPWVDETTQLMWQNPPKLDQMFNVYGGTTYCTGLIFAGRGDWRLPTIDELRTLIRGCPDTVTGGACPVTNSSPSSDAALTSCSSGCADEEGPGHYFEFWDAKLAGESYYSQYFSSSSPADAQASAWYVDFLTGEIATYGKDYGMRVRCVRTID